MKIIINADDFGIDIDRDLGIFYGVLKGYITSVSVIVTNNIGILRKILISIMKRRVSIGIHINLTDNPLLKYKSNEFCKFKYKYNKSKFIFWKNSIKNSININKIYDEIEEQFKKFIKEYKFIPNHIDGHNHCNIFNKRVEQKFEEIAKKYKIHLRIPYENLKTFDPNFINSNTYLDKYYLFDNKKITNFDIIENFDYFTKYDMFINNFYSKLNCNVDNIKFIGTMYGYFRNIEVIKKQLNNYNQNDTLQIMTHPGFYFKFINHKTTFSSMERMQEYNCLKKLKKILKKSNIQYITYNDLNKNSYIKCDKINEK